jgi:hypothetical protein
MLSKRLTRQGGRLRKPPLHLPPAQLLQHEQCGPQLSGQLVLVLTQVVPQTTG